MEVREDGSIGLIDLVEFVTSEAKEHEVDLPRFNEYSLRAWLANRRTDIPKPWNSENVVDQYNTLGNIRTARLDWGMTMLVTSTLPKSLSIVVISKLTKVF